MNTFSGSQIVGLEEAVVYEACKYIAAETEAVSKHVFVRDPAS